MKPLGQILLYLAATVLLGALLAPPVYWAAHAVGRELPDGRIADFFLRLDFHRCFDRAVLVPAVVLLLPLLRAFRVRNFGEDLGLRRNRHGWRQLGSGLALSLASMLLLGGLLLLTGLCHWRGHPPLGALAWLPVTAGVVALVEEWLFRGALQGVIRKTAVDSFAIVSVAILFAAVHFLKPPADALPTAGVEWWSGFAILPSALWQFRDPLLLVGGFGTLLLVGLILGYARWRSRSLALPIGLHAGWIIGKMGFLKVTRQHGAAWPWIGPDILTGLAPICMLLLVWACVWWMLRDEFTY